MPKYTPGQCPADPKDEEALLETARRKKKNADAQAAFRVRRANYIATLEETVTNLESVLLQIQESYRELVLESTGWKERYERTHLELREHEKRWRQLLQSPKSSQVDNGDMPTPDNSTAPLQPSSSVNVESTSVSQHPQHSDQNINYGSGYSSLAAHPSPDRSPPTTASPSAPTVEPVEPTPSPDSSGSHGHCNYSVQHGPPNMWGVRQLPSNRIPAHPSSLSLSYTEPPSLAATDLPRSSRPLHESTQFDAVLDDAPYSFSSDNQYEHQFTGSGGQTTSSSSSSTLASTYATQVPAYRLTFPDPAAQYDDNRETNAQCHHLPHKEKVTRHCDTAAGDALQYPSRPRKPDSGHQFQYPGSIPTPSTPITSRSLPGAIEGSGSGACASSSGEVYDDRASGPKRKAQHAFGRSPSPGPPSLSCTVSIIKAHAFGALRRTQAKTKKSSNGAVKIAKDALEARGIGMGVSGTHKRPRPDDEASAMELQHLHTYAT